MTTQPHEWAIWRLTCGHRATGRADAIPAQSALYCSHCISAYVLPAEHAGHQ